MGIVGRCLLFGLLAIVPVRGTVASNGADATIRLEEAVQTSLAQQTFLQIQQAEVERREGLLQEAAGVFDIQAGGEVRHGYNEIPFAESDLALVPGAAEAGIRDYRFEQTQYSVGVGRLFRNGLSVDLSAELDRQDSALIDTAPPIARSRIVFGVNIPVLRGLGETATAGFERAAAFDLESGLHAANHAAAQVAVATAVAFWNALAADQAVVLRRESQERAEALQRAIIELVEGNEIPPSALGQSEANLAQRRAEVFAAEAAAFAARNDLGLALGLEPDELRLTPAPAGDFPVPENLDAETDRFSAWLSYALARRSDLREARAVESSAAVLRDQARLNTRPQVDLRLEFDYAGVDAGEGDDTLIDPFTSRQAGPGAFAVLTWQFPVGNQALRGRYDQQRALYRQAVLSTRGLTRSIGAGVTTRLNNLASNYHEFTANERAVSFSRQALRDEEQKFQLGMSTLLDVVQTQERLTVALLARLESKRQYAENLAQLRFELGDLLAISDERLIFTRETLLQPPRRPAATGAPSPSSPSTLLRP